VAHRRRTMPPLTRQDLSKPTRPGEKKQALAAMAERCRDWDWDADSMRGGLLGPSSASQYLVDLGAAAEVLGKLTLATNNPLLLGRPSTGSAAWASIRLHIAHAPWWAIGASEKNTAGRSQPTLVSSSHTMANAATIARSVKLCQKPSHFSVARAGSTHIRKQLLTEITTPRIWAARFLA
jgi:hypothetical protein